MGLEQALQELYAAGKLIEISWLWDGGVDVNAGGEERNFSVVADLLPWFRHWYGLKGSVEPDILAAELQKMYDSELTITLRIDGNNILLALGNDFTGFQATSTVAELSQALPELQQLIHKHWAVSKYDVERLGGTFVPKYVEV